jgi:hypothetical protein
MAYAGLNQLREFARIKATSTDDDALLTRLLEAAQGWIESPAGAGRVFESYADSTRYFGREAVSKSRLWLDEDLCAVTSVTNGGGVVVTSSVRYAPRNETPYYAIDLKPSATVVWDTSEDYEIAVVGRWAYSTIAPDAIVQATLRLAKWMYDQMKTSSEGDRPLVTGDGFMVLPTRVPNDVAAVVWAFRKSPL